MDDIVRRLKQPSTLSGLTWLAGTLGFALNPDDIETILMLVGAVVGAIHAFTDDDKGKTQ